MLSYFDTIWSPSFVEFQDRRGDLVETLQDIARDFGDESHASGRPDYIVRTTGPRWTSQPLPADNAFLVVANGEQVWILEKSERADFVQTAVFEAADEWFDGVCDAFRSFRRGLEG